MRTWKRFFINWNPGDGFLKPSIMQNLTKIIMILTAAVLSGSLAVSHGGLFDYFHVEMAPRQNHVVCCATVDTN